MNYPNDYIPDILDGVTSGTYDISGVEDGPWDYIPSVGFSDIEFYKDEEGNPVLGEFFCLSDNGYGSSDNSPDYALNIVHMKIQKPFTFRHGESTFETYTETENLNTVVIHDPHKFIKWENGADIQVEYKVPDNTWNEFKEMRVLTGRDFDVEGLAVLNKDCAIIGDELMPAIFAVNPSTGVVMSPFVRTPDIRSDGSLRRNKFLSTRGTRFIVDAMCSRRMLTIAVPSRRRSWMKATTESMIRAEGMKDSPSWLMVRLRPSWRKRPVIPRLATNLEFVCTRSIPVTVPGITLRGSRSFSDSTRLN